MIVRIVAEAQHRFKAYQSGEHKAIHPSLLGAVFSVVVRDGGEPAYRAVQEEYLTTTSIDGRETCLIALGKVQTADLANKFLEFQFSEEVAVQDVHTGSISLAANPKVRNELWKYIKENWTAVHKKLSANVWIANRYLKTALSKFASHEIETEIAAFFKDKDTKGYDRGLTEVFDTVRANASYKERDEQLVLEWLEAHGYA